MEYIIYPLYLIWYNQNLNYSIIMKSIQVIQLINQWKSNCYLSNYSFDCPAHLIDDALAKFQSDYNRWYEGVIDIKRLSLTPQLQTVLCYRIANNIYKNGGWRTYILC
jgi:hypothetical protein